MPVIIFQATIANGTTGGSIVGPGWFTMPVTSINFGTIATIVGGNLHFATPPTSSNLLCISGSATTTNSPSTMTVGTQWDANAPQSATSGNSPWTFLYEPLVGTGGSAGPPFGNTVQTLIGYGETQPVNWTGMTIVITQPTGGSGGGFDPTNTPGQSETFYSLNNLVVIKAQPEGVTTTDSYSIVPSVAASASKCYVEAKITTDLGSTALGVVASGVSLGPAATAILGGTGSVGYYRDGHINVNNGAVAALPAYNIGDVIGMAIDQTAKTIVFYNRTQGTGPSTAYSISSIGSPPYLFAAGYLNRSESVTGNFAGPFLGAVPSGFQAWTASAPTGSPFPLFTPIVPPPLIGVGGGSPPTFPPPTPPPIGAIPPGVLVGPAIAAAGVPPSTAGKALIIYTFGSATTPPASAAFPEFTTTFPSPPIVFSNIFTDGVSPTTPPSTASTLCITLGNVYGPPIGPALPPVVPVSRPFMVATNGNPNEEIHETPTTTNDNGAVYDDSDEEDADWVEDTPRPSPQPPKPKRGRGRRK